MDSVTSYGSGGSEEALLAPDTISFSNSNSNSATTRLPTSPRRANRENLPLLRGGRVHQRLTEYEDIDSDNDNIFPGKLYHVYHIILNFCQNLNILLDHGKYAVVEL